MLAVFEKGTGSPPEELGLLHGGPAVAGGGASLSRHQILASLPSDSVTFLLPNTNFIAISKDHHIFNTSAVVVDDVFCMFSGNINNLSDLRRHYGLWRQATEAMVLIEAFKVLRDRAPYPPDQVVKDIDGSFSFVIFDANTSSLFVARDREGVQPLEWGLASDESLVISNDPKFVTLACGKTQAHFPPDLLFFCKKREVIEGERREEMGVKELKSKGELDDLVKNGASVILHFWAAWCDASKQMDEIFSHLSTDFPAAHFFTVEAEEQPEISHAYSVSSVPYFVIFKDGRVVETLEGSRPAELAETVKKTCGGRREKTGGAGEGGWTEEKLKGLVGSQEVMLFIKGTPDEPRCGFSSRTVEALRREKVRFGYFDILGDDSVRQGLKLMSKWPTFPQLYYKGELVGGCDIVLELLNSGLLASTLSA